MSASEEAIVEINRRLGKLVQESSVPLSAAQRFVKDSANWYGHPKGPARAPKHNERVASGAHGWEVEFGANRFLVESAIKRCVAIAREAVSEWAKGGQGQLSQGLRSRLVDAARSSVANSEGHEYPTLYPAPDGYMHFGTQSIHAGDFVNVFLELTAISRIRDL